MYLQNTTFCGHVRHGSKSLRQFWWLKSYLICKLNNEKARFIYFFLSFFFFFEVVVLFLFVFFISFLYQYTTCTRTYVLSPAYRHCYYHHICHFFIPGTKNVPHSYHFPTLITHQHNALCQWPANQINLMCCNPRSKWKRTFNASFSILYSKHFKWKDLDFHAGWNMKRWESERNSKRIL